MHIMIKKISVLVIVLVLSACGGSKPALLKAEISASPKVNPDTDGTPSPITVMVFQLKEKQAFANADFFSIIDADDSAFDGAILYKSKLQLPPGKKVNMEMEIKEQAQYLAVVGAYRNIGDAGWLQLEPLPEKIKGRIAKVVMAQNRIILNIEKK